MSWAILPNELVASVLRLEDRRQERRDRTRVKADFPLDPWKVCGEGSAQWRAEPTRRGDSGCFFD